MCSSDLNDMLVINGVDMQTNSHTTGVLHNWSGRNAEGFPTLTAMFAAHNAPEQPLSYISFGGFSQTANLIRFSRLDNMEPLRELLDPGRASDKARNRRTSDLARIDEYRNLRLERLMGSATNLRRQQLNMEAYKSALSSRSALADFSSYLPEIGRAHV